MNKIYAGQTSLSLRVNTACPLNDAELCEIRYRKPDGSEGAFEAVILDPMTGLLGYDLGTGDLDQPGWWSFWSWVQFSGGRWAPGDPKKVYIRQEGR
jgi:hypothetical protein